MFHSTINSKVWIGCVSKKLLELKDTDSSRGLVTSPDRAIWRAHICKCVFKFQSSSSHYKQKNSSSAFSTIALTSCCIFTKKIRRSIYVGTSVSMSGDIHGGWVSNASRNFNVCNCIYLFLGRPTLVSFFVICFMSGGRAFQLSSYGRITSLCHENIGI